MSGVYLSAPEEEELWVSLKPQESELPTALRDLLKRIEKSLFERLTIGEVERLADRFKHSGR